MNPLLIPEMGPAEVYVLEHTRGALLWMHDVGFPIVVMGIAAVVYIRVRPHDWVKKITKWFWRD